MAGENKTQVSEFMLLGFPHGQPFLFVLFPAIYLATLLGNSAVLALMFLDPHLQSPMYFFFSHLSCLDICHSSVTMPKMLFVLVSYLRILATILGMPMAVSCSKASSTCSAHLLVVTQYCVTANLNYNQPSLSYALAADTLVSALYCIITPMLNPLIYSFRNQEVWGALWKAVWGWGTLGSPGSNAQAIPGLPQSAGVAPVPV